ncbi:TolC family protein [Aquabacterium sp.]|uniref:TolC family protein n=1 Tax=Aquabacterium sp. TaxID=1872578 RepID=UPI0035B4D6E6
MTFGCRVLRAWLLGLLAGCALATHAACVDDAGGVSVQRADGADAAGTSWLRIIAREAAHRSAQIGAARLLSDAAEQDIDDTKGGRLPQVSLSASVGPSYSQYAGQTIRNGNLVTGTLTVTGLIYDGGRLNYLTAYREQMAGAARYGLQATTEEVVLEAVNTALERDRYRMQARVYQQYASKMSCLVETLQQIVQEDRGRSSELVQARKNQAQAEIARDNAIAASRQIDIRLRRLIGDDIKIGEDVAGGLHALVSAEEVLHVLEQGNDLKQARAQADGAQRYAEAVDAAQKPQVSWVASSTDGTQSDIRSLAVQAGLSVSYSLFNGGSDKAAAAAAYKRAEAARRQYDELLNTRRAKAMELSEVASSAMDRARRYVDVLRDSQRVREFTYEQWSQIGRRSLFDVMSAEGDHFNLLVAYVNALHDTFEANAQLRSLGGGLVAWLHIEE